jgi:hypothetical protein
MKYFIFSIVTLLLLPACVQGSSPINDKNDFAKNYGENCTYARHCNGIAEISCRPELDGPVYYVDAETKETLATCGGACMILTKECLCNCPPDGWTCDEPAQTSPALEAERRAMCANE